MNFRINRPARRELREAAEYYAGIREELRVAFLRQIRLGIEVIVRSPLAFREFSPKIRRYLIKQFPYGLLYEVVDSVVIIVAVMHLRRRPGYWRDRPND